MLLKSGSDDQFKAIAVVGMAGVGKQHCAKKFSTKKRMLECLGVDDEVINSIPKDHETQWTSALHLELMTKKYLIVLEDCEETDEWYEKLYNSSSNGEKWGEQLIMDFQRDMGEQ
ncbi:hypothetical protein LWI29_029505 [Acer saccharum]|uniref:Uncharacterized protein n=1 Tax=Acer saccharum TaxID=4024 RepID=A0AA39W396_ACESA|nr:hypothetical protein LWI29_029505 [Acer saccharum]